jgi:hypothetical protein
VSWDPSSAGPGRFRLREDGPVLAPAVGDSGLTALSTPSAAHAAAGALSLDNPLVVFGGLAAVVFGLMAFSTSGTVRVGKTKLSGAVGIGST